MSFSFINKNLWVNNLKTSAATGARISVFVICVEAIINMLIYDMHHYTLIYQIHSIRRIYLPKLYLIELLIAD